MKKLILNDTKNGRQLFPSKNKFQYASVKALPMSVLVLPNPDGKSNAPQTLKTNTVQVVKKEGRHLICPRSLSRHMTQAGEIFSGAIQNSTA